MEIGIIEFYKVSEVAKLLKVKPLTVYRWINNGKIPFHRVGGLARGSLRVKKTDFETWVDESKNLLPKNPIGS